jgi:polysaccharide pyruvyl transferase WcaK-like protein
MTLRTQLGAWRRRDLGIRSFVEERLTRLAFTLPAAARDGSRHLLLAAPGNGNIGDQAMFESFLASVEGPVCVLVRNAQHVTVSAVHRGRVDVVSLPALVYGTGRSHVRDVRRFRSLLGGATSLSIIGADVMDGAYNLRASLRRALLAELAAGSGVDTRILGFSWNANPRDAAVRALQKASRRGAVLMLRDPFSAERARADGLENVVSVADTVFSLKDADEDAARSLVDLPSGRHLALVNVSALIGRKFAQEDDYEAVVRHLHARGFDVLLVPHVCVPGMDDRAACRAVLDRVDLARTAMIDRVLSPAEIKGLCAQADLVLTGRMHLSIMALSAGVPAITLASQGKVEGLMSLFEAPFLAVEPRPGMAADIIDTVDRVIEERDALQVRLVERMERVLQLSAQNFVGLAS